MRITLVVSLVEALENLFQLAIRNATARVCHRNEGILGVGIGLCELEGGGRFVPRDDVEGERDASARGRELHRVGQEVHHDLLHLVHIGPHREGVLEAVGLELDALGAGVELEQLRDALERGDDVALRGPQLEFLVADAVEVQELVHQ